jgi:hypothetical protein
MRESCGGENVKDGAGVKFCWRSRAATVAGEDEEGREGIEEDRLSVTCKQKFVVGAC